jgi:LEA14-like dessication related protein
MNRITRTLTTITAAIVLCLSGCTFLKLVRAEKLENPTFRYVSSTTTRVTPHQANVNVVLSAYNPNSIGLKNVTLSYELFFASTRFLKGRDISIALKPKAATRITVPVEIVFKDVWRIAGPASKQLFSAKKSIPIRVDASIVGKPTVYNSLRQGSFFHFTVKVSRMVEVPLSTIGRELGKVVQKMVKNRVRDVKRFFDKNKKR